jgi:hypothetical protein
MGSLMQKESAMTLQRIRFRHEKTFKERLKEQSAACRAEAEKIPPGTARELLLKRARQAETASQIDEWFSSPGLQSPK